MSRTENQKAVTAYLSRQLYDQLSEFKLAQGLRSDSQAIAVILEQFFQQSDSRASTEGEATKLRLDSLEDSFTKLWIKLENYTRGAVYADVPDKRLNTSVSTAESTVQSTARLIICKLYKNNADDPQQWRYWAGAKQGFVTNLDQASSYKSEGAVKRQLNLIHQSDHAPTTRERVSWKPYEELKVAIANRSAAVVGVAL